MSIKITNGALVHRVWEDGQTELLAHFQYELDADLFAELKADDDKASSLKTRIVRTGLYDGQMLIFSPQNSTDGGTAS